MRNRCQKKQPDPFEQLMSFFCNVLRQSERSRPGPEGGLAGGATSRGLPVQEPNARGGLASSRPLAVRGQKGSKFRAGKGLTKNVR